MMIDGLRPALSAIGFPPEVLPMAIVRPLTGSGSAAVLLEMKQQYGADSLLTRIAGVIYGSSETTFYVIAVYFGAVNIRKTRHALPAGLIADVVAVLLAVYVVRWFMGG
jgi:spore maturation protein B